MLQMLHNMMAIVSRTVHRQDRFLRRQVFDLALTLMIIGAGILLLLAAMIAGGMTAYAFLRPIAGPAGALAIITVFLALAALVMGLTGYLIQAESDRRYGLNKTADENSDNKQSNQTADTTADMAANMTPEEAARDRHAYEAWLRTHQPGGGSSGADGISRGAKADRLGLSAEQLALAQEALGLTQAQLDQKLDIVRRHPIASVGVAAGLGLLLGQSKTARKLARTAVVVGGNYVMDHYLNDQPTSPPAHQTPGSNRQR